MFKHLTEIEIFTRKQLEEIIKKINLMFKVRKKARQDGISNNTHKKAVLLSTEPSTRTLGSYGEATRLLGWSMKEIIGKEVISLVKGESYADTLRMLAGQGADVLVMRSKIEGVQKFLSKICDKENLNLSVQNAGDGTNQHPTQALLDLTTIYNHLGRLDNFKIGFFGDLKYGRTVHSLLRALSLFDNVSIYLASDPETRLSEHYKKMFSWPTEGDTLDALSDCDIIYGTRIQKERFAGDPVALLRAQTCFQISKKNIGIFKDSCFFLHPLPMPQSFPQFHSNIRNDKRVIFITQADTGIPTRMFLLDTGWKNRCKKTVYRNKEKSTLQTIISEDLKKYLKKKGKKKEDYFRPIQSGTVIDHIPKGMAGYIEQILLDLNFLSEENTLHIVKNVSTKKEGSLKDVLILTDIIITSEAMKKIASISPDITFNLIYKEKNLFEKKKVKNPDDIEGLGTCPNKNCVTNHESEAISKFHRNNGGYKCYYCGKLLKRTEIF